MIVSSAAYNSQRLDIVIMAITSQMRSADFFGDTAIADWKAAGLLKPSVLKPIFTTVEKGLVLKKLGCMSGRDREALHDMLQTVLGEPKKE